MTSSSGTSFPRTCFIDVIFSGSRPQGLIRAEVGEVGVHVEGEAVVCDPVGHGDADGGDLPASHPHPRMALDSDGLDAEARVAWIRTSSRSADEALDVGSGQPDDGIAHELPGAVVGGVASPLDLEDRDVLGLEVLGRGLPSQGYDVVVLDEDQRVDARSRPPPSA